MRFEFRAARQTDGDFLLRLFLCSRPEFEALDPSIRQTILSMQHEAQQRSWHARFGDVERYVVRVDDAPAAAFAVSRGTSETVIVDIAVLPEFRRRGIACEILASIASEGRPIELTVQKRNAAALRLYERFGFVVSGESGLDVRMRRASEVSIPDREDFGPTP